MKASFPIAIKYALPLMMFGFTGLVVAGTFAYTIPAGERQETERARQGLLQEMVRMQGTLEAMIRHGDVQGLRREIAVMASRPEHASILIADDRGRVIVASRLSWIDRDVREIPTKFDPNVARRTGRSQSAVILTKERNDILFGYIPLLTPAPDGRLRSRRTGTLYIREDIGPGLRQWRERNLRHVLTIGGFTGLMAVGFWGLLHYYMTRRVERLVFVARRLARGDLNVRTHLAGDDELARIGQAFDSMAGSVAETRERLATSEERLKLALEGAEDYPWDLNAGSGEVYFEGFRMLGYDVNSSGNDLAYYKSLVHPEERDELAAALKDYIDGRDERFESQHRLRTRSGYWRWVLLRGKTVARDANGRPLRITGTCRDITTSKAIEAKLQGQALIIEQMFDAVIVTNLDGRIVEWNPAARRLFGFERDEMLGTDPAALYAGDTAARLNDRIEAGLREEGRWTGEIQFNHGDGTAGICETTVVPLCDDNGQRTATIAVHRDITERVQAEERMRYLAAHDLLTGLPNRALFLDRLAAISSRARRTGTQSAILFVDLDGFKPVNDRFGHQAGDDVLVEVARRLTGCLRKTDTAARTGGDEFLIALAEPASRDEAGGIAERILDAFLPQFTCAGGEVSLGASIGIALTDGHEDAEVAIHRADEAMYAVKREGKNGFRFAEEPVQAG